MRGSGQEDGTARYTQIFNQEVELLSGMAALYPGDLPLKAFATGLIMVLSSIGIYYSGPDTDITTAVIGVMILYLGTAALFIQYVFNLKMAASRLQRASKKAYEAAGVAYWAPRWPAFDGPKSPGYKPDDLRDILLRRKSDQTKLTEANLCEILAGHLEFKDFAKGYFPSRWSMLLWPIQKLTLPFKPELAEKTNTIEGYYTYTPGATLEGLKESIALMATTDPSPKGSHLIIAGVKCGERKVLISNIGSFDSVGFSNRLKEAVVQDLLSLAQVVEDKTKITAAYCVNWWLAQPDEPNMDEFIGTVTKYRSLAMDASYGPGIKATLAAVRLKQHRLLATNLKHPRRFGQQVQGKRSSCKDVRGYQCSSCPHAVEQFAIKPLTRCEEC